MNIQNIAVDTQSEGVSMTSYKPVYYGHIWEGEIISVAKQDPADIFSVWSREENRWIERPSLARIVFDVTADYIDLSEEEAMRLTGQSGLEGESRKKENGQDITAVNQSEGGIYGTVLCV